MSDNIFAQATGDTQKLKRSTERGSDFGVSAQSNAERSPNASRRSPPAYRNQLAVLPSQRDWRQGSLNAKVVLL